MSTKNIRLLVAPDDDPTTSKVIRQLEALDSVWLEPFPSFRAAARSCRYLDPPDAVLTIVTPEVPGILELMTELNSCSPTVPILAITDRNVAEQQPSHAHPSLTLLAADSSVEGIVKQLTSTIAATASVATPRRGIDFLLAAVLSNRSITLDLRVADMPVAHIEFVGGDIWNAYAGDLDSIDALAATLLQPVEEAEVKALHTIPGERQIALRGLEAISKAFQDAPRLYTGEQPPDFESVDTLEIQVASVRAEYLATQQTTLNGRASTPAPGAGPTLNGSTSQPSSLKASGTASTDPDPFEEHLAAGFQAALARDYKSALHSFEQALILRPGDTKAEFNLGRVKRQLVG